MSAFILKHSSISQTGQYVLFSYLVEYQADNGTACKLRFEIKSDAYREQCFARVSRWSGEKWMLVAALAPGEMDTMHGLTYRKDWDTELHFENDYDELMKQARLILS